jgi:hypothetical protein
VLWDVFISHASEDKTTVARPLAAALEAAGLRVWIDEAQLKIGDSLRQKLDEGLSQSRFGVVVLSPAFFAKQWPQRELGAILARPDAVLPVWHGLGPSDLATVSPLLADVVAASTSEGIAGAAERILQVAGTHLPQRRGGSPTYTSELAAPMAHILRALDVLESLSHPATWAQLDFSASGYPAVGWMGTDSSTFVEVIYGFLAPLIEYRRLQYSVRRNLALLDTRTRLQFALLETAFGCFCNESELATADPAIEYTPRVPQWRSKRLTNAARYWWQGISPDRFDAAVPFFIQAGGSARGTDRLLAPQEFLDVYRRAFASRDAKVQQAIGLVANGFYGFRPASRPVLWRVCISIARIYQAILGNSRFDPTGANLNQFEQLYHPLDTEVFPFRLTSVPNELYEPYPETLAATLRYLEASSLPRIRSYLAAPREDANGTIGAQSSTGLTTT